MRKVFTSQRVTLYLNGKAYEIYALVSPYGIKQVFNEQSFLPEFYECLKEEIPVSYRGIFVRCRFISETSDAGTIYNLRFIQPDEQLIRMIEEDVRKSGLPSPWIRCLPRLGTALKQLPSPVFAAIQMGRDGLYLNVRNFTLGGIFLEHYGEDIEALNVGRNLEFDLVTNEGEKLIGFSGQVVRVSEEQDGKQPQVKRIGYGIKFLPTAGAETERRYRALIREHCEGIKELGDLLIEEGLIGA